MQLAITDWLLKPRRWKPIEGAEGARTHARITRIFSARILIIARLRWTAHDRAHAQHAIARRCTNCAHRPFDQWRMQRISIATDIGRAWLVVVRNVGIVICRNDFTIYAIFASTIPSSLFHERRVCGI